MGVIIVGMHRSGTSALAGALEAMGLTVGAPEGLMKVNRENPAGYYEQQSIADFNDELLAHLGGAWDCPPALAKGWSTSPALTPFVTRATKLVDSYETERFLLKDPRTAVLLPLWRRAVIDRCSVVMIVRDPIEVAWSLLLRNGLPLLTGLALWSAYYRAALAGLDGLPVHICSYENLLRTPRQTLREVAESLQEWSELPGEIDIDVPTSRIQPDLRRDTWPRSEAEVLDVPEEVVALDKLLAERHGAHHRFEGEEPPVAWWERPLLDERRRAWELRRQNQDARDQFERKVAETNQLLVDSRQRITELEHKLLVTEGSLQQMSVSFQQMTLERDTHLQEVLRSHTELALWKQRWRRIERTLPMRILRAFQRGRSAPTDLDG
jgi:hypothetical protein